MSLATAASRPAGLLTTTSPNCKHTAGAHRPHTTPGLGHSDSGHMARWGREGCCMIPGQQEHRSGLPQPNWNPGPSQESAVTTARAYMGLRPMIYLIKDNSEVLLLQRSAAHPVQVPQVIPSWACQRRHGPNQQHLSCLHTAQAMNDTPGHRKPATTKNSLAVCLLLTLQRWQCKPGRSRMPCGANARQYPGPCVTAPPAASCSCCCNHHDHSRICPPTCFPCQPMMRVPCCMGFPWCQGRRTYFGVCWERVPTCSLHLIAGQCIH
jgi:hypothetical protein